MFWYATPQASASIMTEHVVGVLPVATRHEVVGATAGPDIARMPQKRPRLKADAMLELEDGAMHPAQIPINADHAVAVTVPRARPQPAARRQVADDLTPQSRLQRPARTVPARKANETALGAAMPCDHRPATTFAWPRSRIEKQHTPADLGCSLVDGEIAGLRAEEATFNLRRRAVKAHAAVLTDTLYEHRWLTPSVSGPRRLNHARGPNGVSSVPGGASWLE
jgi:hypothetical protein